MILSVEELKKHVTTSEKDDVLAMWLKGIEAMVRKHTNNRFQDRNFRVYADIHSGLFVVDALTPFEPGDTVQISNSDRNDGLYVVSDVTDSTFTVNGNTYDENDVMVTKVVYPEDVKMGVINLFKWEGKGREKVGIESETISRHSVTYYKMNEDGNNEKGYPAALMKFLEPYMCARFGQGVLF